MTDNELEPALFIEGEWIRATDRASSELFDPANGNAFSAVPHATVEDLDRALQVSLRGFNYWRHSSVEHRATVLNDAAQLMRQRIELIAAAATREQGKPLAEARLEVKYAAALTEFYAAEARRAYGRVLVRPTGSRSMVMKEPIGPTIALCPWNFPIVNPVRKLAPAIAAGCSVIIKPPEEAPRSAIAMIRCFLDAGLPHDVLSVVFGVPQQVSSQLIASPITRKVSFTGSVSVGRQLAALAGQHLKKMTLELGGHSPVIVFDDADIPAAAAKICAAKFRNAGQVCVSPTRILVQNNVRDEFVEAMTACTDALTIGSGIDPHVHMGPLANPRRTGAMEELVADALDQGAKIRTGGRRPPRPGYFFEPTIICDAPISARIMNEEPFGPVALVQAFDSFETAVLEANRLPFGLASYCFTSSLDRAHRTADALSSGMVGINNMALSAVDAPFGGVKDSGYGSEDGPEGMDMFMVPKSVHMLS
jgi:succinate-semialdehyde dehydrogenase / glutarate-semialdehyde dehydrogenase